MIVMEVLFLLTDKTNHMTREEYYRAEERRLLDRIAFNERIHCHLVANRHRRELEKLRKEYGKTVYQKRPAHE